MIADESCTILCGGFGMSGHPDFDRELNEAVSNWEPEPGWVPPVFDGFRRLQLDAEEQEGVALRLAG